MTFGKTYLASLLATITSGIVLIFIFFLILGGMIAGIDGIVGAQQKNHKKNTVLHIQLNQRIGDVTYSTLDRTTFQPIIQLGLIDIINAVDKAKSDSKVKGIYLNIGNIAAGMASIKEIREALEDFKSSGKFIIAFHETYSNKSYYLSSVADEIYMYPTGMFEFLGLGSEIPFLKGTFDKLDIDMQIIRGTNNKFKSAVEPLMYDKMSPENKIQTEKYLNTLWNEMLVAIEQSRGISLAELNLIADSALTRTPNDAVKLKFLTGLKYYDEIEDILAKKADLNVDQLNLFKFKDYVNKKKASKYNANIAVVSLEGDIVDGNGKTGQIGGNSSAKLIRKVRKDTSIKAVVLRVNSPGGSALASDLIWREITLTKAVKPVIVSMGDVAASGGYYVACAADKIYAEPNTITGSIGVFGVIPFTGDLMKNKLGITFDRVETNAHSVISMNKRLSDSELKIIQAGVDDIYLDFITKVANGRNMTTAQVDSIGQGRVWAGKDAKAIGLIDEFGGLKAAISEAADRIGINSERPKIKVFSTSENDKMLEIIQAIDENAISTSSSKMQSKLNDLYNYFLYFEQANGIQAKMPYLYWID